MALRGRATQQSRDTRKTNKQSNQPSQKKYAGLFDFIFHIKSSQIGHALDKKIDDDFRGRHEGCQTWTEFLRLR